MKTLIIIVTLIATSLESFSQKRITDSAYYDNGTLMSFGSYDSLHKHWKYYQFYETGQVMQISRLDPIYFSDVDTSFAYHRNGQIAWIFPYKDRGYLTGKLLGYYLNGSIKREAYFYRSIKTGTWKEYYPNGKIKSISFYEVSSKDSSINFSNIDLNNVNDPEYFIWGAADKAIAFDSLYYGKVKLALQTFISKKIGKWKTYDSTGKVRPKRLTDFENCTMVRYAIGMHELSFEKIKQIYEKSSSFEELALLLEENNAIELGQNRNSLLENWHNVGASLQETLNEPRLALGLPMLTFKRDIKTQGQSN